jgi:hypothetical protein
LRPRALRLLLAAGPAGLLRRARLRRARREDRARPLGLALGARGDLERRAVWLEDSAGRALLALGLGGRAWLTLTGGPLAGLGRALPRGRALTGLRRTLARGRRALAAGRPRRRRGRGAVGAERTQRLGLVHDRGRGGHVDARGAQLEQRVARGHAAFLCDFVHALFCHQRFDSTRSLGTDTERRNARVRARRRTAFRRHSGPQT